MQPPGTPMGLDKRALDTLADWRDGKAWDGGFLGLIGRFAPWFDEEGIEYQFYETVAVRLHGGTPSGRDAALLLTPASWRKVLERAGERFEARDRGDNGSLSCPECHYASRVTFRSSLAEVTVSVHGVRVSSLPFLFTNL